MHGQGLHDVMVGWVEGVACTYAALSTFCYLVHLVAMAVVGGWGGEGTDGKKERKKKRRIKSIFTLKETKPVC